jgi:hypothetical protein
LDYLFPEAGVAVRIVGLTAKGQRRQSDWEAMEEEQRDQTRVELCRLSGIQLFLLDPLEDPVKQMDGLLSLLSRSSRSLAQSDNNDERKSRWMPQLGAARDRVSQIRNLIAKNPEQMMGNLAESWRDRESGIGGEPAPAAPPVKSPTNRHRPAYAAGQRVQHERFGAGVITDMNGEGDDATLTILFDGDQQRTFLMSLVGEKLSIIA